jgi:hypothetical protein
MKDTVNVKLIIPAELGAAVLADSELRQLIKESPGVEVEPVPATTDTTEGLEDIATTVIAIASAPAAVAAVNGLFKLFHIIVEKAYELRKLKMEQEHELTKILLQVEQQSIPIPLDQNLSVVTEILSTSKELVIKRIEMFIP